MSTDNQMNLPGIPNMVDHPPHYNFSNIEVIQAIEAWKLNYHRGSIVK